MSRYTEVTHITKEQSLQLEGLLTLARYHRKMLDDIETSACQIVGEKQDAGGHTSDAMYEGYDAKTLLGKLDIIVSEQDATP